MEGPTYQPSMLWGAKEARWSGVSCTSTLVPGGANGVQLELKGPEIASHADSLGWRQEDQSRFRDIVHSGSRRYHSLIENCGSRLAMPARKWFFHVWIACSTAFLRWT